MLGDGSVEAAHVAVAARMQDPTGKKYIEFHQKLLGGRGAADKARALAVAKEVGFDMGRIEKDMDSHEVKTTIDEDMKLADALGVNGTPSYVVGDEVVVGAVGLDELKAKLSPDKLRTKPPTRNRPPRVKRPKCRPVCGEIPPARRSARLPASPLREPSL